MYYSVGKLYEKAYTPEKKTGINAAIDRMSGNVARATPEIVHARFVYDSDDKTVQIITDDEYKAVRKKGIVLKNGVKPSKCISDSLQMQGLPFFIGAMRIKSNPVIEFSFGLAYVSASMNFFVSPYDDNSVMELSETDFCFNHDGKDSCYVLSIQSHYDRFAFPLIDFDSDDSADFPHQNNYPYTIIEGGVSGYPIPSVFAKYMLDVHKRKSRTELFYMCSSGILFKSASAVSAKNYIDSMGFALNDMEFRWGISQEWE